MNNELWFLLVGVLVIWAFYAGSLWERYVFFGNIKLFFGASKIKLEADDDQPVLRVEFMSRAQKGQAQITKVCCLRDDPASNLEMLITTFHTANELAARKPPSADRFGLPYPCPGLQDRFGQKRFGHN